MKLILACLATALLVLAGAWSLRVEPTNAADGPRSDPMADILAAHRAECLDRGMLLTVKNQAGILIQVCDPFNVGTLPVVQRRAR